MSPAPSEMPLPSSVMREPTAPTIVTSSPSRIHTVPRPTMIIQWNRAQGSRSNRAGIAVRTTPDPPPPHDVPSHDVPLPDPPSPDVPPPGPPSRDALYLGLLSFGLSPLGRSPVGMVSLGRVPLDLSSVGSMWSRMPPPPAACRARRGRRAPGLGC
ncbi:hypothetical protein FAIPA1_50002 [Frankia sp. AiPs1]